MDDNTRIAINNASWLAAAVVLSASLIWVFNSFSGILAMYLYAVGHEKPSKSKEPNDG